MGVSYSLVNNSRREVIVYQHLPASSKKEIAGCAEAAAVVAWYMLEHPGDEVAFVDDIYGRWPFRTGSAGDLVGFREVTDEVVDALVGAGILRDDGRDMLFDDEPDIYLRRVRNIWDPSCAGFEPEAGTP